MKVTSFLLLVGASLVLFAVNGCKKQEKHTAVCDGSTPTYDADIKSIIDASCMGSLCHSAGANRGDFTSYALLKGVLDNGSFKQRVLATQDMPRGNETLSPAQLDLIQCWVDDGYPEN